MSERVNPAAEEEQTSGPGVRPLPPGREPAGRSAPERPRFAAADEDDDLEIDEEIDEEVVPAADDDDYEEDGGSDVEADALVEGPAHFQPRQRRDVRGGRREFRGGLRGRPGRSDVRLEDVTYKNIELLSRFVDPRGRILSRRKTKVSAKLQRRVTQAIKQARELALLPYTGEHVRITRKR